MTNEKSLFSRGRIGHLEIPNRVVMPAMGTALASACGEITDHHIAYYERRASGGVGLIIFEACLVEPDLGKSDFANPRIDNHRYIPMMHRLANAIHKYDTRVFAQLHHAGRQSNSALTGGPQIVAPSPVPSAIIGEVPRALSLEEIADLEERFVQGALRCKMAGMDGVEIHAAHGYLIDQFFSPASNQRSDDYGGSFDNRMRFAVNIIQGIKRACGRNFPVIIRLSVDEFVDGGITMEEGVNIAMAMEKAGVDGIHASCGTYESFPKFIEPFHYEQGWRAYLAEAVKKAVDIPVIAVGVIREPSVAERILNENKADFVSIGRGVIADPDWCHKAQRGEAASIRKCISCLYCIDNAMQGAHLECAINACAGRELEFNEPQKNGARRKVFVVGGGPAGMEATRILAMRDFDVILFEKRDRLGGQSIIGSQPNGKEKMRWLIDYLQHELTALNVDIRFDAEAHHEAILAEKPYAVFVGTGGKFMIPDGYTAGVGNVFDAETVIAQIDTFTKARVAVIGAGMTGCEVAELIASRDNQVLLVEMLGEVAADAGPINKMDMLAQLNTPNIHTYTQHKFVAMDDGKVTLENLKKGSQLDLAVDKVVFCLGVRPDSTLYEKLDASLDKVYLIGDARKPRRIADAIREGYTRAMSLGA